MSRFKSEKGCANGGAGMAQEWRKRVRHRTSVSPTGGIGNGAKARHRPFADATGDLPCSPSREDTCASTAHLPKTKKEKQKSRDTWQPLGEVAAKIVERWS